MKKVVHIIAIALLFVMMAEQMEAKAAANDTVCKNVGCITVVNASGRTESNAMRIRLDNRAIQNISSLGMDMPLSHKKNTITPTTAPKKSSDKKEDEDDGYGLGGFIVLVILAIAYFKSRNRKNTVNVRVKK